MPAEAIVILVGAVVIVVLLLVALLTGAEEIRGPGGILLKRFAPRDQAVAQAKKEAETATGEATGARAERDSIQLVLRHYAEIAEALPMVIDASPATVQSRGEQWANELATRLAQCLKTKSGQFFRVAVWFQDPGRPDIFVSVGLTQGAFSPGGASQELTKAGTIGGLAFSSEDGSYNCHDTLTDTNYKSDHPKAKKKYRSIYAQVLGNPRWGVMTIDAVAPDAFGEPEIETIVRFSGLAALGVGIWYAKVTAGSDSGASQAPKTA